MKYYKKLSLACPSTLNSPQHFSNTLKHADLCSDSTEIHPGLHNNCCANHGGECSCDTTEHKYVGTLFLSSNNNKSCENSKHPYSMEMEEIIPLQTNVSVDNRSNHNITIITTNCDGEMNHVSGQGNKSVNERVVIVFGITVIILSVFAIIFFYIFLIWKL